MRASHIDLLCLWAAIAVVLAPGIACAWWAFTDQGPIWAIPWFFVPYLAAAAIIAMGVAFGAFMTGW